jgi:alkylhydroperoxidase/carboxymuconolactone decarboxylase family protein YurZ
VCASCEALYEGGGSTDADAASRCYCHWRRGLKLNIRTALNNGATRQDIVETLLHIAPYAGFLACWEGLTLAQKVFGELDQGTANVRSS